MKNISINNRIIGDTATAVKAPPKNTFLSQIYNSKFLPFTSVLNPSQNEKKTIKKGTNTFANQQEETQSRSQQANVQYSQFIQKVQKDANRTNLQSGNTKKRPMRTYQDDQEFLKSLPAPLYKPDFPVEESDKVKPEITKYQFKEFLYSTASETSHNSNDKESGSKQHAKPQNTNQMATMPNTVIQKLGIPQKLNQQKVKEAPTVPKDLLFTQDIQQEQQENQFVAKLKKDQQIKQQLQHSFAQLNDAIFQEETKEHQQKGTISIGQFDFQSHLIYKHNVVDKIPNEAFMWSLKDNYENGQDNKKYYGAISPEIKLAYSYLDDQLLIWKVLNQDDFQKISTTEPIICVKVVSTIKQLQKQYFLIVTTPNQILKFGFYDQLRKGQIIKHDKVEALSSDGYNISEILQTQNGRIFVGGQGAVWKEIDLFSSSFISGKLKMKKVDDSQGVINRLIPSFFKRSKQQLIVDIVEHKRLNVLFFAIQDYNDNKNTHIAIYDQGRTGTDSIMKISNVYLDDILERIVQQMENNYNLQALQKEKLEISRLITSENTQYQLIVALNNGMRIYISFNEQELPFEEYVKSRWINKGGQPANYKSSVIESTANFSIIKVISSPVDYALNKYYEVWNDNIQNEYSHQWKPLMHKTQQLSPSLQFHSNVDYSIVSHEINNETKEEFFAVKTINSEYFIVYQKPQNHGSKILYGQETPNYISQYIISARKIDCEKIYDIVSETVKGKQQLTVLTNVGIQRFMLPTTVDFMASYFKLQLEADPAQKILIDEDFQIYLDNQKLSEVLTTLLEIAVENGRSSTYLMSSMCHMYYTTKGSRQIQMSSKKEQMKLLIQTMANYINQEQCYQPNYSIDTYQLAAELFIALTETNKDNSLVLEDDMEDIVSTPLNLSLVANGQQAYINHQLIKPIIQQRVLENERIIAIYAFISRQLHPFYQSKLFRKSEKDNNELVQNFSPEQLKSIIQKVEGLLNLISRYRVSLDNCNQSFQNEGLSYQEAFESQIQLLLRIKGGVQFLLRLFEMPQLRTLISKTFTKSQRELLMNITLTELLVKSLALGQVCDLATLILDQIQTKDLNIQAKEFKKTTVFFIQQEFIDLYIARRYLSEQPTPQNQAFLANYLSQGINIILKRSLDAQLQIAVAELLRNDLVNQTVQFCLKKAQDLDFEKNFVIQNAADYKIDSKSDEIQDKLKYLEDQQDQCFCVITEIVQSLVRRIQQLDTVEKINNNITKDKFELEKLKPKLTKQNTSKFNGINIFREKLDQIKDIVSLVKVKEEVLRQATQNTSKFLGLHKNLSYYLYSEGLIQDLVVLKSPYVQEFMQLVQTQVEPTENLSKSELQKRQNTNLQLTYSQLQNNPELCFIHLSNAIQNPQYVIDIDDRIQWMQKADGCYHKMTPPTNGKQLLELQEQYDQLNYVKELVYTTHQMRNKIRKLLQKMKQSVSENVDDEVQMNDLSEVEQYLSTQLLDWEQLYSVANDLKLWSVLLKIIYQSTHNVKKGKEQVDDIQNEIYYSFENIISTKYSDIPLDTSSYHKLQAKLLRLYKKYGPKYTQNINNLEYYPINLILDAIQAQNLGFMLERKDGTYLQAINVNLTKEWHPFWLIEFIIQNNMCPFPQLFDILYKQYTKYQTQNLSQHIEISQGDNEIGQFMAETTFFVLYLTKRWLEAYNTPMSEKSYQLVGVMLEKAKDIFQDELSFSKIYHKNATQFLEKMSKILIRPN